MHKGYFMERFPPLNFPKFRIHWAGRQQLKSCYLSSKSTHLVRSIAPSQANLSRQARAKNHANNLQANNAFLRTLDNYSPRNECIAL
jgi:hypothetical protein